jgi:hypothetical protein
MTRLPRAARGFLISATAILTIAGCSPASRPSQATSPTSTAPPAGWPAALNDFSFVWTAEPGIDVTTWPAVAVRAYTESYLLAYVMGDKKYLYPGFQQAVDPNQSADHPTGTQFLWPTTDDPSKGGWIGTEQAHILSIATSGSDITVAACTYQFGSAQLDRNGKYSPVIAEPPPYSGIAPMRITMTAPAQVRAQMPPQQGPARAPSVDVFNGWRITSHQGGYFARSGVGPEWPDFAQTKDTCLAKAPAHHDFARGAEYPPSDYPTLPPAPGWPAASSQS